jgi:hypothetical protein
MLVEVERLPQRELALDTVLADAEHAVSPI